LLALLAGAFYIKFSSLGSPLVLQIGRIKKREEISFVLILMTQQKMGNRFDWRSIAAFLFSD
jgi:hypothetical protein